MGRASMVTVWRSQEGVAAVGVRALPLFTTQPRTIADRTDGGEGKEASRGRRGDREGDRTRFRPVSLTLLHSPAPAHNHRPAPCPPPPPHPAANFAKFESRVLLCPIGSPSSWSSCAFVLVHGSHITLTMSTTAQNGQTFDESTATRKTN